MNIQTDLFNFFFSVFAPFDVYIVRLVDEEAPEKRRGNNILQDNVVAIFMVCVAMLPYFTST